MVENVWKLHLDPELNFVNKSDEPLVLMRGDNLKAAYQQRPVSPL